MLKFLKIESYRKGIAFSSAFNLLSKLLLFGQSLAIAYYFGAQSKTDVYFFCFTTITLVSVFVNSLDSSVLIPEAMRLKEVEGTAESVKFLNFFVYRYALIGIVATALLWLSPVHFFMLFSKFDPSVMQQYQEILYLSIPLFGLMVITNLLVNILTSYKFFTIPMIVSSVNGMIVLLFIILFHNKLNISSVLIGQLTAYFLNILFLIYLMHKHLEWHFRFSRVKLKSFVLKNILYAQAGNITSVFASYIPLYLLSSFSSGVITALTYGQKTAEVPNQLITNQSSAVVGIKLNELYAKNDFQKLNDIFVSSANLLVFVLTPISLTLFLYSESVIRILFQRGEFTSVSTQTSCEFFRYFVVLLPMLAVNTLVSRLFMAGQKIMQSFLYQIVFNCVLIGLVVVGLKVFGLVGYPLALVVLHVMNVLACHFLLRIFFPHITFGAVLIAILKTIAFNAVIFLVVIYIKDALGAVNILFNLILGSAFYAMALITANWYLKVNVEFNEIALKASNYVRNLWKS